MKSRFSLLRFLPLFAIASLAAWAMWPGGVTASYRTYTADFEPERLADGFDFPVGRGGSAVGYYMARKMSPYHHLGDDWNGIGGGNSDYGDSIFSIADGVVVYSQNYGSNWGQVIIIRHKYKDHDGRIKEVDSLYGHVINRKVSMGSVVRRGQQIAQIGNNNGMYLAHLHLEIRKNTDIGIQGWNYSKGLSNYHRPDQFIAQRRPHMMPKSASVPSFRLASAKQPKQAPAAGTVVKKAQSPAEPKPQTGLLAKIESGERKLSPRMLLTARYADRRSRKVNTGPQISLSGIATRVTGAPKSSPSTTSSAQVARASSKSSTSPRPSRSSRLGKSSVSIPVRSHSSKAVSAKAPVSRTLVAKSTTSESKVRSRMSLSARFSERRSRKSRDATRVATCAATTATKRRSFGKQ